MHLHDGAVQRHRLDADAHHLGSLKLLEYTVQHAAFGPTVHARIDGVPVAEALGQAAPFAAVLGDIQDGVQHTQIRQTDILLASHVLR